MSIECRYCERDLRGPHNEDCPRYDPSPSDDEDQSVDRPIGPERDT